MTDREPRLPAVSDWAGWSRGAPNAPVKAADAAHDLSYPPGPSSREIGSIGGNVATNAGGLCWVKYGVTADYVLAMQGC